MTWCFSNFVGDRSVVFQVKKRLVQQGDSFESVQVVFGIVYQGADFFVVLFQTFDAFGFGIKLFQLFKNFFPDIPEEEIDGS